MTNRHPHLPIFLIGSPPQAGTLLLSRFAGDTLIVLVALWGSALVGGCTLFADIPEAPTGNRVCAEGCGTTVSAVGKLNLGVVPSAIAAREHLFFALVPDANDATDPNIKPILLRAFDPLTESTASTLPLNDFVLDGFRSDQRLQLAINGDVLAAQSPQGVLFARLDSEGTPTALVLPQTPPNSPMKVTASGLLVPGFKALGDGLPLTYRPTLHWLAPIPGLERHFFSIACFKTELAVQSQCTASLLAFSPTSPLSGFDCLTLPDASSVCEKKTNAIFTDLTTGGAADLLAAGRTSTEALFILRSGDQRHALSFPYADTDLVSSAFAANANADLATVSGLAIQHTTEPPTHYVSLNASQASVWLFAVNDRDRITDDELWLDLDLSPLRPRALAIVNPDTLIVLGEQNAFGLRLPGQKGDEQEMQKLLSTDWSGFAGLFIVAGPYVHVITGQDLRTLQVQSTTE